MSIPDRDELSSGPSTPPAAGIFLTPSTSLTTYAPGLTSESFSAQHFSLVPTLGGIVPSGSFSSHPVHVSSATHVPPKGITDPSKTPPDDPVVVRSTAHPATGACSSVNGRQRTNESGADNNAGTDTFEHDEAAHRMVHDLVDDITDGGGGRESCDGCCVATRDPTTVRQCDSRPGLQASTVLAAAPPSPRRNREAHTPFSYPSATDHRLLSRTDRDATTGVVSPDAPFSFAPSSSSVAVVPSSSFPSVIPAPMVYYYGYYGYPAAPMMTTTAWMPNGGAVAPTPSVTVGHSSFNGAGSGPHTVPCGARPVNVSPFAGAPMRFHPSSSSSQFSQLSRGSASSGRTHHNAKASVSSDRNSHDDEQRGHNVSSPPAAEPHLSLVIEQFGDHGMRWFADLAEVERHFALGWKLAKEPAMLPAVSLNAVELFVGQVLPEVRMVTVLKLVLFQVAAQCNHRDLEGGIRECVVGRGKTAKAPGTKAYQITVLLPPEKPFPTNSVVTPQVVSAVNRSIFVEVESVPGGAPVHSDPTTISPDGSMSLPHPTTTTLSPPAAATADNSECRAWLWRHQQVMPVDLRATLERNLGGAISGHSSHNSNATAAASSALPEWRASSLVVELPYSRTKVQQPMLWLRSTAARSPRVML